MGINRRGTLSASSRQHHGSGADAPDGFETEEGERAAQASAHVDLTQLVIKRVLDTVLSSLLLALLSPLMILVWILIKLDSRGPALFIQDRMGAKAIRNGEELHWEARPFRVLKFRSMADDSDEARHRAYIHEFVTGTATPNTEEEHATYKLVGDPRITRVGTALRRTLSLIHI